MLNVSRLEQALSCLALGLLLTVAEPAMTTPAMAGPIQSASQHIVYAKPKQLADFRLTDTAGAAFSPAALKGKWSLVVLGFTHCPDICPTILNKLSVVRDKLSETAASQSLPQIAFIGVDPDRDREILKEYTASFGDDVIGATGPWEEVKRAILAFKAKVQIIGKTQTAANYEVRHSAFVTLVDTDGRAAVRINPDIPVEAMAKLIADYMRDPGAAQKSTSAPSPFSTYPLAKRFR